MGGPVGPVQVLQDHHDRGALRAAQQQSTHRVKDLQLLQPSTGHCAGRVRPSHLRQEPTQAGHGHGDLRHQVRFLRIVHQTPKRVHDRQVGKADVTKLHTVTDQHPRPPLLNLVGKLDQQPGLAYPGIAGQQHQLGLLLLGPV
jgi:hypothetical protein